MHSLEEVKKRLVGAQPGLALDIDDTLSMTWAYWSARLMEKCGAPPGLSWQEIRQKYQRMEHVPEWTTEEALALMEEMRFNRIHLDPIERLPDSYEMVSVIHQEHPIHVYLTARPEAVLGATLEWLRRHDFPDVPVLSRPTNVEKTASYAWKASVLQELYPSIVGIVDDDVKLAEALPSGYAGTLYLIGHEKTERQDIRIVHCPGWQEVRRALQVTSL